MVVDQATRRVTPFEATRLTALFTASVGVAVFGLSLAITVGDYGDLQMRALQFGEFFLSWPLWALLISGIALFGLTVGRNLTSWWDFAWRGAVASYLGIVAATSGVLIVVEVVGGGDAGGFFLVIVYVVGFTVIGGPLLAGLVAALFRPRRITATADTRSQLERTDARRRLGYVLLFTGAAVCLGLVVSNAAMAGYQGGMEYKCLVDGPRPTEPPLAVVSEASGIVEGSFTLWPIGRQCEWDRAVGNGTVTVTSGAWGTTAFAGAGALTALVGAGVILASAGRAGARRVPVDNSLT